MSAEILRRAASLMRENHRLLVSDEDAAFIAVADWLDDPGCGCPPEVCDCCSGSVICTDDCRPKEAALNVARAYLGESA